MDRTRALLNDSGMEKEMWGEAIQTSTYLINRSPSETVEKTPAEVWNGKKPDLSKVRLFGSVAYAKITKPIKKLEDRSKKHVMIGYAPHGYRLWDLNERKIIISREVKFIENIDLKNDKMYKEEIRICNAVKKQDDEEENKNGSDSHENEF